MRHGHRLTGHALDDFIAGLRDEEGWLIVGLRDSSWSVRFGVNGWTIQFGDHVPSCAPSIDDRICRLLRRLVDVHRLGGLDVAVPTALTTFVALLELVGTVPDPTHHEIAARTGLTAGTVARALSALRRIGVVDWQHQTLDDRQIANTYLIRDVA